MVQPIPAEAGRCQRYDYHCWRVGTCNLVVTFCPRRAWQHITITRQRTKSDFARQVRALVDVYFPSLQIRLVVDNLNIRVASALYETFEAAEARCILRQLHFHYTPVHASWLNIVESAVLSS